MAEACDVAYEAFDLCKCRCSDAEPLEEASRSGELNSQISSYVYMYFRT